MAMQNEVKRQTMIIVGAIVVGGLAVIYLLWGYVAKSDTSNTAMTQVAQVGKGAKTAESPHYNEVQRKFDNNNAESAEATGKTYLSGLSTRETPVKPTEKPQASKPTQQQVAQQPTYLPPPPSTGGRVLSKDDMDSLKGMMAQWTGSKGIVAARVDEEPDYAEDFKPAKAPSATDAVNAGSNSNAALAALQQVVVVEPYATTYGLLQTQIDTDEASMVKVIVPAGQPYEGAVLFANGYKRLQNDVDMTFDAMLYKGRSYKITAKPLDVDSGRTALTGDVHHHYFARIVLPAIATGLGATGALFANAGQQSVVSNGTVITNTPETPSARNIAGSFVGGLGQNAGQVLSQEAAQIPVKQTIVERGEMIGIQFIGPVLASDDLSLAKNTATGQGASKDASGAMADQPAMKPAVYTPPQPHMPSNVTIPDGAAALPVLR